MYRTRRGIFIPVLKPAVAAGPPASSLQIDSAVHPKKVVRRTKPAKTIKVILNTIFVIPMGSIGPSPSKSSEEVQIVAVYIIFGRQVTESRSLEA